MPTSPRCSRARAALTAAALLAGCAAAPSAPTRAVGPRGARDVLFVGNSFSYYNNGLHNHYRRLLRAAPNAPEAGRARLLTLSGGHLWEQLAGLRQRLAEETWQVVVLQGHSLDAIAPEHRSRFEQAARTCVAEVRRAGAEPVLLMTWAYSDRPEMTAQLEQAYAALGESLGVDVLPVGSAFAACRERFPDVALHVDDRRHPTPAGTYLAACVVLASLHAGADDVAHDAPAGVAAARAAGLDARTAGALQQVARQAVARQRRSAGPRRGS